MKIIVTLVIVALLIIAAILYFGSGDLDLIAPKTPSPAQAEPVLQQDFRAISTLLQQDMTNIPLSLDAPRVAPSDAFSVKSRLGGAMTTRVEYQMLVQACDLIIYADEEHSVRQRNDQVAQQAAANGSRADLHTRAQADWAGYRQQTDAEVKRLLASLQNAKL